MKKIISILVLVSLISACSTTQAVKQSRGKGLRKHYSQSYDEVYKATLDTVYKQGLHVEEHDKETGFLYATHGLTLWSWGERIAIYVYKVDGGGTEVEIVSRKVFVPLNFAPDWAKYIFTGIEAELQTVE